MTTNNTTTRFAGATLRAIVSSVFGVNPRNVHLSATPLAADASFTNYLHTGSMGETRDDFEVWSWGPDSGFRAVDGVVGSEFRSEYAYSEPHTDKGKPAHLWDLPTDASFLLLKWSSYDGWSGRETTRESGWTLYPVADFQAHRDALEAADVSRWQGWYESLTASPELV